MDKIQSLSTHSRTYEEIAIERIKILTDILQVIKQDPALHVHLSWRLPSLRSDCAVYSHACAASPHMLSKRIKPSKPDSYSVSETYKPVYELLSEVLENNY
jgi:hypothetical protein